MANGSILIPEKFKLNKKVIQVIVDDDYCNDEKLWGEADFTQRIITLCHRTKSLKYPKGKVLSKATKERTFYHELVHHILNNMGQEKLSYDEDFVDEFACKLYEYEKTKQ